MSQVYLGQITLMAITFAPRGWHACDGSILSINENTALFTLIGTSFGGNGTQNFALPDLRSRVPVCAGSGAGLSTYSLGERSGTETMSLTLQNLAPHTHAVTSQIAVATRSATTPVAGAYPILENTEPATPAPAFLALNPGAVTVASAGGGFPFSILQPFLAVNFYIALQGLFPARN